MLIPMSCCIRLWTFLLQFAPLLILVLSAQGQTYVSHGFLYNGLTLIDMHAVTGNSSIARGLNDRSHVVGQTSSSISRGFLVCDTNVIDIDLIQWTTHDCVPQEVNMATQVVGSVQMWGGVDGRNHWFPFIWRDVNGNGSNDVYEMTTLGNLHMYGYFGAAYDINDQGQIVGGADTSSYPSIRHAFLITPISNTWYRDTNSDYVNDLMTDLGTLGGSWSEALDINESNAIVGYSTLADNMTTNAVLWNHGVKTNLNCLIPRNSGWVLQEARGVNNSGQIAGYGTITGQVHAFLLSPAESNNMYTATDLGTLGGTSSAAHALNEAGQVVGWAQDSNGRRHAFLWSGGRMKNLGELTDGTNGTSEATDINNLGQVAGQATRGDVWNLQITQTPTYGTEYEAVLTNEFNEVSTQLLETADGFVMRWTTGWADWDTNALFTVECWDPRTTNSWTPILPTNQWPVLEPYWTNAFSGALPGQMIRVRAASRPSP